MFPFALFAFWRCTVVQNVFFKIRGRRGGGEAKRRRRRRSRAIAARWNTTTKNVLPVLAQITRIEYLCYHLVLTRERLDANHHTDTPCGEFVKPLSGDHRTAEVVVAT